MAYKLLKNPSIVVEQVSEAENGKRTGREFVIAKFGALPILEESEMWRYVLKPDAAKWLAEALLGAVAECEARLKANKKD